jgi:BirA family biotin operon repressor/biotin-[acetyl-CoA-carboxylase] ligase
MPGRDIIDAAEVNSALSLPESTSASRRGRGAGSRFAGYVQHFASIQSTNRTALQAAQRGARCGVWVADEQTAGRGRGGHSWHSAAGEGLYVSALVAPHLPVQKGMWLALATGLAAQQAIEESCGLRVDLRWPNDLMLNAKKCGGILVETSGEGSAFAQPAWLAYAVIGIGINVNHRDFPPDLQSLATSLRRERGVPFVRQPLLIHLLRALEAQIALLEQEIDGAGQGPGLMQRFSSASTWVRGRRVHVPEQGGYTGTTAGLDPRGFLLVDADDGQQRTVLSGGVRDDGLSAAR